MDLDTSMRRAGRGPIAALVVTLVGVSCAALVARDDGPVQAAADPVRLPICAVADDRRAAAASAPRDDGDPPVATAALAADARPSGSPRR